MDRLIAMAGQGNLTHIFGARDAEHSDAAAIAEVIQARLKGGGKEQ